ncbi:SDR family oxidoreductase [Pseudomonas sp. NY15463]|uniref:SDR family oxidoreductase n=1 Tax=Pseudomonas sp. NY15463 TaxID=3400361 RepID=UPI003A83587C
MNTRRSIWVTGASSGLGVALVERLLEQGHRVAASGRESQQLDQLNQRFGKQLLRLPGALHKAEQAQAAGQRLQEAWGTLDTLIINAGTCDYLDASLGVDRLFDTIVTSNLQASEHCLGAALGLLKAGNRPQVMAVLSRHAAQQLYNPNQPTTACNSLHHWLREQRPALSVLKIDLTVVAPQPLKSPLPLAMPEDWDPQRTAQELVARLDVRERELVLEVLNTDSLWPLPN